ncbi:MAG: hypothetical protein J2P21_02910 [Chloracidobacterium sp.]|nr:hypothetical protein [Chloracidobacterium sp.]
MRASRSPLKQGLIRRDLLPWSVRLLGRPRHDCSKIAFFDAALGGRIEDRKRLISAKQAAEFLE